MYWVAVRVRVGHVAVCFYLDCDPPISPNVSFLHHIYDYNTPSRRNPDGSAGFLMQKFWTEAEHIWVTGAMIVTASVSSTRFMLCYRSVRLSLRNLFHFKKTCLMYLVVM